MRLIRENVERTADGAKAKALLAAGYVQAGEERREPGTAKETAKEDLNGMTAAQLRALAKSRGIKGAGALNRGELLAALEGWSDGA